MRKPIVLSGLALIACFGANHALAQETSNQTAAKSAEAPVHYYHLEFVVQEIGTDGKPVNSRVYTVDTNTDHSNRGVSIRTGSRVPVPSSASSFQYVDLGVNIDVHSSHEVDGKLALDLSADISSLATGTTSATSGAPPVIRSNRWQAPVLVPLNKATTVFTSDSLDTKGSMQIQVTAKPVQ